jgi:hypothetical protein
MRDWPPITEPLLRERQAMTDDEFFAHLDELLRALPARACTEEHYERAIGYPWGRPPGSCLVTADGVTDVDDDPGDWSERVREMLADDRVPLLAYGANASPERLSLKLAHMPEGDREVLILAGELEDFDVGAAAQPPYFSSIPATLIESPGTTVRVAVLLLTPAQFIALWWTEHSYKVGALDPVTVTTRLTARPITRVIAFSSRYGAFAPDGAPVAMAAIPARDRVHAAFSQVELLNAAARLTLGAGATARDLVREAYERPAEFLAAHRPALQAASVRFSSPRWQELRTTSP